MDEKVTERLAVHGVVTTLLIEKCLVCLDLGLAIILFLRLDELLSGRIAFPTVNLVEVVLYVMVVVVRFAAVGVSAWLNTEHHWNRYHYKCEQDAIDGLLLREEIYVL